MRRTTTLIITIIAPQEARTHSGPQFYVKCEENVMKRWTNSEDEYIIILTARELPKAQDICEKHRKGSEPIMILHKNPDEPLGRAKTVQEKRGHLGRFLADLRPGVALSLACCFLAAIFGPLELFFNNLGEFKFGFGALFPVLLRLFFMGFLACLGGLTLSRLLYRRLYDVLLCAGLAGLLAAYLQGMFFAGDLPPLDGTAIRWGGYRSQHITSLVLWGSIWVGVVLAARFLHRRGMYRLVEGVSLFLTAVMLVTGVSVGIMNHGFTSVPSTVMTVEGEFTMSEDQNLVVLVVDATDGQTFTEMLESDHPEFGDMLADFTFYPNTVGAYPFTKYALPYLLHGQWYENQDDYDQFTQQAMAQSPLLENLRQQGYRMGIYEEDAHFVAGDSIPGLENVRQFQFEIGNPRGLMKEELKLVWFKYAPWPLKGLFPVNMERFGHLLRLPEGIEPFDWRNPKFYESLGSVPVETVPEKCFRFIHIEGAHVPFRYDKDVNLIENGSYKQNMECTMTVVSAYLQKLRDAGVYENTAIVLLADHGYADNRSRPLLSRCNPLLAVKGIGEQHPMEVSEAPVSYEDLQELYRRLLDGETGEALFDAREGENRTRRALMYHYLKENYIAEYFQMGYATDMDTLVPSGEIYER